MRNIICLILSLFLFAGGANASSVDKVIKKLNVNKGGVSVSVRDVKNGNVVYSLNPKTPMNPASTLKLITFASSINTLGYDYEYVTELYKSSNNDLYFKLSGDPMLKSIDLSNMLKTAKGKNIVSPKNVYLDASVFDEKDWGEGWQWDDDLNPAMPKFSAYNLDGNVVKIEIAPVAQSIPPTIVVNPFYPFTFMNAVNVDLNSKEDNVEFSKNNDINNVINVSGTISSGIIKYLPVPNQKRYFTLRLENAISKVKLGYFKPIKKAVLPKNNIYLVDKISHPINNVAKLILKDSNNFAAETLFKTAGAVWSGSQGTTENSLKMLDEYLAKLGLDMSEVTIVDGSGVSKNNLLTSDFMTKFLKAKYYEDDIDKYKELMVSPGEGTLEKRMLYFRDNLKVKTGTLSGVSALAGYITTRRGNVLAFDIMINDSKISSLDKKNLEEQILRQIYMSY